LSLRGRARFSCHHERSEGSAFLSTIHQGVILSEDAPKGRASESKDLLFLFVILSEGDASPP
jgi:hypothetical protein